MSQISVHVHNSSRKTGPVCADDAPGLQERLHETQRLAKIGHWELDLAKDQLYWSEQVYRIFELDPASFTSCYQGFLEQVHPDDRNKVNHAFVEAVRCRQPYEVMHRLGLDEGRIKYVKELGQAFYDEEGQALRVLGTVQDITDQVLVLQALERERETQQALQRILAVALEPLSLEQKLESALEELFRISWLNLEHKGSISLMDPEGEGLHLVAGQCLNPELRHLCSQVPLGSCLCGQAAQSGQPLFKPCLDEDHHHSYPGMTDHGHYISPIVKDGHVLGVLNLYVAVGHGYSGQEADFFRAVAQVLAAIISRHDLEEERDYLFRMLDASPDPLVVTDQDGRVRMQNHGGLQLFGKLKASELLDLTALGLEAHEHELIRLQARQQGSWSGELRLRDRQGRARFHLLTLLHSSQPKHLTGYAYLFKDISDRKALEEAAAQMAVSEKQFSNSLIQGLPGLFLLLDQEGRILRYNRALADLTGLGVEQLMHRRFAELLPETDGERNIEALCRLGGASEVQLRGHQGQVSDFRLNCVDIVDAQGATLYLLTGIDITDSKRLQRQLAQQAKVDALTGAYNRRYFSESVHQAMKRCARYEQGFAIILFDIDDFKQINDAQGHPVGDEVLCEVVARTHQVLREADLLARWGGEEFIILSHNADHEAARQLAERVRAALGRLPIGVAGQITASFGVALFEPGETVERLFQRVDELLYRAKRAGKDRVVSG